MAWKSIDIRCEECGSLWDDIVDSTEVDNKFQCPECGKQSGSRTISAPNFTKASYVDGTNRFKDLKEISKLKIERAKSDHKNRKGIEKEIRRAGGKIYNQ